MKNSEVRNLVHAGFANLKYKGMSSSKSAYKVVKLSSALEKCYKAIEEERMELVKKVVGDKMKEYQAYQEWYFKNDRPEKPEGLMDDAEYRELEKAVSDLVNELFDAEADIKYDMLSFDEYMELAEINDALKFVLGNANVELSDMAMTHFLEGVIWEE